MMPAHKCAEVKLSSTNISWMVAVVEARPALVILASNVYSDMESFLLTNRPFDLMLSGIFLLTIMDLITFAADRKWSPANT